VSSNAHGRSFENRFPPRKLKGNTIKRLHREERGVAMVELAIALPVLLVVLLGIVEFGRALVYWNDTTQIASVGARWAIVNEWPGKGTQSLQDAIKLEVPAQQGWEGLSDDLDEPVIELLDADGNGTYCDVGDAVRVTVAFTFRWTFMPSWIGVSDRKIVSTATMRLENLPDGWTPDGTCDV
jgi:Flp pilus assembly pilin Flp